MDNRTIIISIIAAVLIFILILVIAIRFGSRFIETPEKRAGRMGEKLATGLIKEILKGGDLLFTNIPIKAAGKQTEIDNLIINKNGIFIIEVKNYSGEIFGEEDDSEWIKNKVTPGGNIYQKVIKNPIGQVKRQEYILAHYLKEHGFKVWVRGYVFFVEMNSPIKSSYVLDTRRDIDRAIHGSSEIFLDGNTVRRIADLFS